MVFGQSWGTGMWKQPQEMFGMWGQTTTKGQWASCYCFQVGSHPKSALGTLLNPRSSHFMGPALSAAERHLLVSLNYPQRKSQRHQSRAPSAWGPLRLQVFLFVLGVKPSLAGSDPGQWAGRPAWYTLSRSSLQEGARARALPWGQLLKPGRRLRQQLRLHVLQVAAIDGLQQHQQRGLADGDFHHRKSPAGISFVLERPWDWQHRDQDLRVWIHPELLRLFEPWGLLNVRWKTDWERNWFFSFFTPPLCPLAGMYVCLKTTRCALDKGCVYKIMFSYRKLKYPAFNMPSGSIRQRLVQAHSTGTTTIVTAANSAILPLALCPFLGTTFLLAWLPASSQAAPWLPVGLQLTLRVCLDFLSIPWVAAMALLGTHPSGPACAAGALSGSRVGSGEGREGSTSSGWGLTLGDLTNQSNGKGSKHNTKVLIEPRRLKRTYLNAC